MCEVCWVFSAPLGPLPTLCFVLESSLSGQIYQMCWKELGISGEVGEVTPLASSCQVWADGGRAPLPRATAPVGQLQGLVTTPCLYHFKPRIVPIPCLPGLKGFSALTGVP